VRTGRIATSISLFNLFVTASRLATLVYTLMLGPLSDAAGNAVKALTPRGPHPVIDPVRLSLIEQIQQTFEWQLRLIILAGLVGTIVGSLLLPMFTYMYERGVRRSSERIAAAFAGPALFAPRDRRRALARPHPELQRDLLVFDARHSASLTDL